MREYMTNPQDAVVYVNGRRTQLFDAIFIIEGGRVKGFYDGDEYYANDHMVKVDMDDIDIDDLEPLT